MNASRSTKRRSSPRPPGSGTAHHKNLIFRRAGRKKGGQDGGPKTEAEELVEKFRDGGSIGISAMGKVADIFDGREKTSQKNLSGIVSALADAVEGEDYNARIRAADFIVKFFGSRDINAEIKMKALQNADKKRDTPILDSIVKSLGDGEFSIRFYAVKALVEAVRNEMLEDEMKRTVKSKLESASANNNPFIRAAALEGLDLIKIMEPAEETIEEPEAELLEEASGEGERVEAETAYTSPAEEPEQPVLTEPEAEEAPDEEEETAEEVSGEEAVDAVGENGIDTERPGNKFEMVDEKEGIVEDKKNITGYPALEWMVLTGDLRQGTTKIRIAALQSIQKLAKKENVASFIPDVAKLLANEFIDVRMEASCTLGEIGKPAIPFLLDTLKNQNADARYEAVWTLGNIRDSSATIPLIEVLVNDPSSNVRTAAVEAMGKIAVANPEAESIGLIFALMTALEDEKKEVRKNAVEALSEILENGVTNRVEETIKRALKIIPEEKEKTKPEVPVNSELGHEI